MAKVNTIVYSELLNKDIEITKPWNNDMYKHNEKVADLMKDELSKKLLESYQNDDEDSLRAVGGIISGIGYGNGYDFHSIWDENNKEIDRLQNFWLAEEYPYGVEKGIVSKIKHEFIGYKK